jgi:hypothetical protein
MEHLANGIIAVYMYVMLAVTFVGIVGMVLMVLCLPVWAVQGFIYKVTEGGPSSGGPYGGSPPDPPYGYGATAQTPTGSPR